MPPDSNFLWEEGAAFKSFKIVDAGTFREKELIAYYGLEVVQSYMNYIQENAEVAVREMLMEIGKRVKAETGKSVLHAEDFMDDGSRLNLSVSIDTADGTATFDFTGSGTQVWGNTNAPRAVTFSALIYSLRCMVG